MSEKDPDRLATQDDDPFLRDLLKAGAKELPSESQLASLAAKLPRGSGGGGPRGGSGGTPATGGVITTKGVGILAVVGAVLGASYYFSQPTPPPRRSPAAIRSSQLAALASALAVPVPSSSGAMTTPDEEMPLPVEVPPPRPVMPPAPKSSVSARPTEVPVLPPAKDSENELKLLQRAQDALLTTPDVALALADEAARRFPTGVLRQETEVIAIQALARMGKPAAAEARAMKFREAYPRSTHLRRIDAVLGHGEPSE